MFGLSLLNRVLTIPAVVLAIGVGLLASSPDEPTVATHYFYWYRWPDAHFNEPGAPGREGHRRHLPAPETVSWLSVDWHTKQFHAMAECGIDVALPVYWGAPGAYERAGTRFSVEGLPPMVEALDCMVAAGEKAVKLGLFYDTSTLRRSVRGLPVDGEHPDREDLTTPEGTALFCATIVEYFERIPPRHWARFDGRPLVVTYVSGFAGKWNEQLGPALHAAFAARFPGEKPYLVADASWGEIGQDRHTSWGAALHGPKLFPGVAQIGPGYDDSPVPGRRTPIREREKGRFYRWSWREAVLSQPELVLIETWNEMHEGTEICKTIEAGRRYLDLTRAWTARLAAGDPGPPLEPPAPLRLRPDLSWGADAKDAPELFVDYTPDPPTRFGLREIAWEDGPCVVRDGTLHARGGDRSITYLYFQISDHRHFDAELDLEVTVTCAPNAVLQLQYDSTDPAATLDGAYRTVLALPVEGGLLFRLPGARLANRQNGGADFRFVVSGEAIGIAGVRVR